MVRGKFQLQRVTEVYWSKTAKMYEFEAVCNDGTPENERYHRATPSGSIKLTVDNPVAQEQFTLGAFYFFDATPVPAPAAS